MSDNLKALAEAATPGERETYHHSWEENGVYIDGHLLAHVPINGDVSEETQDKWETQKEADAAFIAACSPEAILALLAKIEAQQEEIASARESVAELLRVVESPTMEVVTDAILCRAHAFIERHPSPQAVAWIATGPHGEVHHYGDPWRVDAVMYAPIALCLPRLRYRPKALATIKAKRKASDDA